MAKLAGVSIASVSRVLTGARKVRPEIAERVQDAATRLGYEPDQVGRSLRRRETSTIGLVVADITNPFFPALVQAVEEVLRGAGLGLLLADAQNDPEIEARATRLLAGRRVDAVLITPVDRHRSAETVREASRAVPVVQLDRYAADDVHYVGMDHDAAIASILAHLSQQGRTRPALIGSDPSVSTSWERQVAFTHRVPSGQVLVGSYSVEWGRAAVGEILDRRTDVDALVCANDLIALGALQELHRRDIAVPGRVAVTGFDDTLLARTSQPSLTSVRQPVTRMAEAAVRIVTAGRQPVAQHVSIPAELVTRASSVR